MLTILVVTYLHWFLWGTLVLYVAVILMTAWAVIMENRQPIRTIAWVLVLVTIPIVGLIVFTFFGQNVRKMRLISKRASKLLSLKRLRNSTPHMPIDPPASQASLVGLFKQMDTAPIFAVHDIDLYINGTDFFDNLLADISRAQHHIHLQTYILDADGIGTRIAQALIARAQQGVEVRLLYDDVGCWHTPNAFFRRLMAAGVEVYPFMPVRFPSLTHKVNYRNHRKLVIIDGVVGYIGGMNIADRYIQDHEGRPWRDAHIRLRGNVARGLQEIFLTDWYFVSGILINDHKYYEGHEGLNDSLPQLRNIPVQVVTSSPVAPWPDIMYGLVYAIQCARVCVYIQTPYFMPTEPLLQALQTAALAGVKVYLMLPERPDGFWLRYANDAYICDVLDAGARVFRYQAGFLHSKLVIIDDELCTIGSSNMDFRSFENNFEANAFIYDATFTQLLRGYFEHDLASCVEVTAEHWRQRPRWHKVRESLTRLFSPVF